MMRTGARWHCMGCRPGLLCVVLHTHLHCAAPGAMVVAVFSDNLLMSFDRACILLPAMLGCAKGP